MEQFMTVEEAGKILRMHPESVRRLCRTKKLQYGRSGKRLVFVKDQLDAYVLGRGSDAGREAVDKKLAARAR